MTVPAPSERNGPRSAACPRTHVQTPPSRPRPETIAKVKRGGLATGLACVSDREAGVSWRHAGPIGGPPVTHRVPWMISYRGI